MVGLVVGHFGGMSESMHKLLKEATHSAAFKHWRQAGAKSPQAAVSGFVATYRSASLEWRRPPWLFCSILYI